MGILLDNSEIADIGGGAVNSAKVNESNTFTKEQIFEKPICIKNNSYNYEDTISETSVTPIYFTDKSNQAHAAVEMTFSSEGSRFLRFNCHNNIRWFSQPLDIGYDENELEFSRIFTPTASMGTKAIANVEYVSKNAAHFAMPSETHSVYNTAIGATGVTYIAPADGYYSLLIDDCTVNAFIEIINISAHIYTSSVVVQNVGVFGRCFIAVAKGQTIQVNYTQKPTYLVFTYANGAIL